jgi:hypothetical protein
MNKQSREYQEELTASRIGADIESFTPAHSVLSVSLELLVEGEEQVLSFQREFGEAAESQNEVCVVLSPSQKCAYDPLSELVLCRNSLGIRFTEEAAKVFGVASLRLWISAPDATFEEFREKLETLCEGQSFYTYEDRAA